MAEPKRKHACVLSQTLPVFFWHLPGLLPAVTQKLLTVLLTFARPDFSFRCFYFWQKRPVISPAVNLQHLLSRLCNSTFMQRAAAAPFSCHRNGRILVSALYIFILHWFITHLFIKADCFCGSVMLTHQQYSVCSAKYCSTIVPHIRIHPITKNETPTKLTNKLKTLHLNLELKLHLCAVLILNYKRFVVSHTYF